MPVGIQTIFEARPALDGVMQGDKPQRHRTMMAQPRALVRALAHARMVALTATAALALHGVAAHAQTQAQAQAPASTQLHAQASSGVQAPHVNLAFFYGSRVPVGELQAFDAVVIDPASGFDPAAHPLRHTVWLARTHADGAQGTPDVFVAAQIEPLWARGYRGFLLDTPAAIAAVDAIRAAHPDARLVIGGDAALQAALPYAKALYAVIGPSLVRDAASGNVAAGERDARIAA
ncbi:MAG TPA: sugar ABC transporter, partial [Burkholderiales bacterium]|nr:sugar ABC transporter [Burkholderiales bacterium]